MELKPVYTCTTKDYIDFWTNHDGKQMYIHVVCGGDKVKYMLVHIMLHKLIASYYTLQQNTTTNPAATDILEPPHIKDLHNTIVNYIFEKLFVHRKKQCDVYELMDVLFWLNMHCICEYKVNVADTMQWYFNTPYHPFEHYLVEKMPDAYNIYQTEYPPTDNLKK